MSVKSQVCAAALAFAVLSIASMAQAAPAGPPAAGAQAPDPPAMLIVDTEKVLSEAKAMKGLQGQIDGQGQAFQKEFAKKQDDLRSAQAELQKEQATIGPEAFEEKRRAFEKRVAEVQRDAATKRQSLEQGATESIGKVKHALVEVVRDIALERHANMVLQAAPFMIFDPSYDASQDALRRLDQRLPSVQLVLAKVNPPATGPDDGSGVQAAAPAKKK